jgi:hypothetical protein
MTVRYVSASDDRYGGRPGARRPTPRRRRSPGRLVQPAPPASFARGRRWPLRLGPCRQARIEHQAAPAHAAGSARHGPGCGRGRPDHRAGTHPFRPATGGPGPRATTPRADAIRWPPGRTGRRRPGPRHTRPIGWPPSETGRRTRTTTDPPATDTPARPIRPTPRPTRRRHPTTGRPGPVRSAACTGRRRHPGPRHAPPIGWPPSETGRRTRTTTDPPATDTPARPIRPTPRPTRRRHPTTGDAADRAKSRPAARPGGGRVRRPP